MIRHAGTLRFLRLSLALLLAIPWGDALAVPTSPGLKAADASQLRGQGWGRSPAAAPLQVLAPASGDFDESDDGPGVHPLPFFAWQGSTLQRFAPTAESNRIATEPSRVETSRYLALCRFRC